jgi:hypothetical protein
MMNRDDPVQAGQALADGLYEFRGMQVQLPALFADQEVHFGFFRLLGLHVAEQISLDRVGCEVRQQTGLCVH